ncbi:MAG TPA: S8 family serine peptidase [Bdellovibrionales bacterium]|nr:S8 family serine peptidase [Bdellovibrionales bacterium]
MKSAVRAGLRLGVLLTAVVSIVGCTKGAEQSSSASRFSDFYGIFSTRPQTATETIAILKLKTPALLASLNEGKADKEVAQAITEEQNALIEAMKQISPEIRVVYKYRLVINGLAVVAPLNAMDKLRSLANVVYAETSGSFARPALPEEPVKKASNLRERNSVKFIGALEAHARGVRGQGMKVGIIDTGIDFTHAMFDGAGTKEAYEAVDPSKEAAGYPNARVVGGIDLVGTVYDSESANFANRTPLPDVNPLDEGGHGTHVAGTVAGHGDGENTYDGVAPDAVLHAIKVFGKDGSTGDAVIIAGLEYAADPNSDLDLSDRLDVVNLSLGSSNGLPHILYNQAMGNLSRSGTVVVASAGNSGDNEYIVGAPGVTEEAISVAASVDDMDQNWKFRAVAFTTPSEASILVEAIEGTITKPIEDAGQVTGPLVHIGLADQDLSDEAKAKLNGKIAFIDRGVVPFADKIRRAQQGGAIGVVVANNQPGAPLAMGGDGEYEIPGIMVTKDFADKLKAEMAKGEVSIAFQTDARIEKPELIDTIAGFSSRGPRSIDALIKPEISAPGNLVVSAAMGKGNAGVQFSGTSMAAPHMAGVMALLKQTHPTLSSRELKSLAMSTSKTLIDETKTVYSVSRQGAGRVQVMRALDATLVSYPMAVSLGEVTVEKRKLIRKSVTVHNIAKEARTLALVFEADAGLTLVKAPSSIELAADESKTIDLEFVVDTATLPETSTELDGFLMLKNGDAEAMRIPVLAVANKVSQVEVESLVVHSTSKIDAQGAAADLTLKNMGSNAGVAYPFNLIARDARKVDPNADPNMEHSCDLQEAGYRVVQKEGEAVLQIAAKIYEPMTTWDTCEVIALIDADGDGSADQELAGILEESLKGLSAKKFSSVLIDASMARQMRKQFEIDTAAGKPDLIENYADAVLGISAMFAPTHSTVAIIEAPLSALKMRNAGVVSVKIAASSKELSVIEGDDALGKAKGQWMNLNVREGGAAYGNLPEMIEVAAGKTATVQITKGAGKEKLLLLYPTNKPAIDGLSRDRQSEVAKERFGSDILAAK